MDLRRTSALLLGCVAIACTGGEVDPGGMDGGAVCDASHCTGSRDSGGIDSARWASHDSGDRFSDCQLGAGDCAEGERCAWGRIPGSSWTGQRCTSEPGTLEEGAACTLDVRVTFADGAALDTSRCADELVCFAPWGSTHGTCTRPCGILGCDAGQICPGHWESCVTVVACDPETQDPCGGSERCAYLRPIGGAPVWTCVATGAGGLGAGCTDDTGCARELGCRAGRCAERCDSTPLEASPDGGTGVPIGDGGTWYPPVTPTCEDGSLCHDVDGDDGAPIGLCATDLHSDCELDDPSTCDAGERCAWGLVGSGEMPATRCVTESGTLGAGEPCALDVPVSFDDGTSLRTSRCGAGLGCAPWGPDAGRCVVPCDAVGCPAGRLCPGVGEQCIDDVRCDAETGAPCASDQDCETATPYGAGSFVFVCRDRGGVGDACGTDRDCDPSLACASTGRCNPTCDPEWYPAEPGSDGAIPIGDGGWTREPRCPDGSYCNIHWRADGTRTGVCSG